MDRVLDVLVFWLKCFGVAWAVGACAIMFVDRVAKRVLDVTKQFFELRSAWFKELEKTAERQVSSSQDSVLNRHKN